MNQIVYHPIHHFCGHNDEVCKVCGSKPGEGCKYDRLSEEEKERLKKKWSLTEIEKEMEFE